MRLKLIINPISGTHSKAGLADYVEQRLADAGFIVDTAYTTCHGDATRIASQAVAQGFDGVIACGGDGTVNEAARALCGTGKAFGIIPAGSGNGLARHLSIPIDVDGAIKVIEKRRICDCDHATVNGSQFFCTFGLGYDAAVSHQFAKEKQRGLHTYIKSALSVFRNYQASNYRISLDGAPFIEREAFLVACCNASQYGNNAFIAPEASITDGLLDVVIVKDAPRLRTLLVGIDMMSGMIPKNTQTETFRAKHVTIERTNEGPCHIDGEPLTMGTHFDVRCIPASLRMFTTDADTQVRPFLTPMQYALRDWGLAIQHLLTGHA